MIKISINKTRYDKGQIFPFLIAIIVVIIIIAMITVNLGQISIFKTDVSNAADSAALSGASILSGYLLQCGLKSDMMSGQMLVAVITEMVDSVLGVCLIIGGIASESPDTVKQGVKYVAAAIMTYIATWINMLVTYLQTLEEGKMAWSNAKKSALQYAFQNAGIDEPRPTFKQFVKGVYGKDVDTLDTQTIANYNEVYYFGDDPDANDATRRKIQAYTENGFSRFMRGPGGRGGYWDEKAWGEIKPGNISPPIVTSGYGWEVNNKGEVTNSYDKGNSYTSYDNYVEVQVVGNVMYPLRIYMGSDLIQDIIDAVYDKIDEKLEDLDVPDIVKTIAETLVALLVSYVMLMLSPIVTLVSVSPGGLQMGDNQNAIKEQTDDSLITVTVKRHKKDSDLGLWKFRYGTPQAQAQAHAYRESNEIDIKPLIKDIEAWKVSMLGRLGVSIGCIVGATAIGIVCSLGVTAVRTVCMAACPAACIAATIGYLVCLGLCEGACIAGGIAGHVACAKALIKGVEACEKILVPKEEQFGWFDTRKHLFETELTKVR